MQIKNSSFTWAYVVPNMYDFYIYKNIQTKPQKSVYLSNNLEKNLSQSSLNIFKKIYTIVFNIDNNMKCFLSSKSDYDNDFWRSRDTEDWCNDAVNSALHHRNTLHFTIYSNKK